MKRLFMYLVEYLINHQQTVTINTGLMYGHKRVHLKDYEFTELGDNVVVVTSTATNFYYKCSSIEEMIKIVDAILIG